MKQLSEQLTREIFETFRRRCGKFPGILTPFEEWIKKRDTLEAAVMAYIASGSPLSDLISYPFELFEEYALHGAQLFLNGTYLNTEEEKMQRMFLQYVAFPRVNEEELALCRKKFYGETKQERDGAANAYEAVIALNYWCASRVTYRASDERCAGALTVYDSGVGRCGEESCFAVNVLRSCGIPARQVYAPRWAHCDDNHAWVEVFVDGGWHFIGACEPEEMLDKGWFLYASSRAVLIHSRWFGPVRGWDESAAISANGIVTELNETARYAVTEPFVLTVFDNSRPAANAKITVSLLNYAEWFPIVESHTDEAGRWQSAMGAGTVRVTACLNGRIAEEIVRIDGSPVTLHLAEPEKEKDGYVEQTQWISVAPQDQIIHSGAVTKEQEQKKKEKLAYAREKYRNSREQYKENIRTGEGAVAYFLSKYKDVEMTGDDGQKVMPAKEIANRLYPKDRLDVTLASLTGYFDHVIPLIKDRKLTKEEQEGLLNCRVHFEVLTDYSRKLYEAAVGTEYDPGLHHPQRVYERLCAHVMEEEGEEYDHLIADPYAVFRNKKGTALSRDVLFVALCRSFGVAARLDKAFYYPEYFMDGKYVCARGETRLQFCIKTDHMEKSTYFENWSVVYRSPLGERRLINVPLKEVTGPDGEYEIITANRLPDGDVPARRWRLKTAGKGGNICIEPELPKVSPEQMLVDFVLPEVEIGGAGRSLYDLNEDRVQLLVWLRPGEEPTEHILNELADHCGWLKDRQIGILFFAEDEEEALRNDTVRKAMGALPDVRLYSDKVGEHMEVLGRRLYINPETAPLAAVTRCDGHCIFAVSGYNVGTADLIEKVVECLYRTGEK